jgi:hypothetical protein
MTRLTQYRSLRLAFLFAGLFALVANAGCVQLAANLIYAWQGGAIPAEYDGLKGKRVAVVALTDAGVSSDPNGILLANFVRGLIDKNVKKVDLVKQDEVDGWFEGDKDNAEGDFVTMGKGVKADLVVAVEMTEMTLREGPTLFRGNSNIAVTVYDIKKDGKPVFRKKFNDYGYPEVGGMPTTETDETKFRRIYLMNVADKLAHHFYPHELGSNVANDASILGY